jgi:hypothetical protein
MADAHQAAVETYRYLRVGIVLLAVLLGISVAGEILFGGSGWLDSISAYYGTPVRDVFVGVLFALALGLIVVRGRGIEDELLNIAGMLAAVVAVVQTTIDGVPIVEPRANGPWSLAALGLIGVVVAAVTARRLTGQARSRAVAGVVAAATVVAGFATWLGLGPDSFFRAAHYVAAVGLFGVLVVVARLNARSAVDTDTGVVMRRLPAERRRAGYAAISWAMLTTVVVAGVLGLLELNGRTPVDHWLFFVEAILLALFAAFWVLQTIEYWRDGVPLDPER